MRPFIRYKTQAKKVKIQQYGKHSGVQRRELDLLAVITTPMTLVETMSQVTLVETRSPMTLEVMKILDGDEEADDYDKEPDDSGGDEEPDDQVMKILMILMETRSPMTLVVMRSPTNVMMAYIKIVTVRKVIT